MSCRLGKQLQTRFAATAAPVLSHQGKFASVLTGGDILQHWQHSQDLLRAGLLHGRIVRNNLHLGQLIEPAVEYLLRVHLLHKAAHTASSALLLAQHTLPAAVQQAVSSNLPLL